MAMLTLRITPEAASNLLTAGMAMADRASLAALSAPESVTVAQANALRSLCTTLGELDRSLLRTSPAVHACIADVIAPLADTIQVNLSLAAVFSPTLYHLWPELLSS